MPVKVAIASGKGGTGKTMLSVNLAGYLSMRQEVVLVDLDVEEPNAGLFVGGDIIRQEARYKMIPEWIEERCTLCDICQRVCNFNAVIRIAGTILVLPELCHGCYACSGLCPTDALPMKKKKMGVLTHYRKGNLIFIESRLDVGEEQAVELIRQTKKYAEDNSRGAMQIFDSPPGTSCPVIEATKDAGFVILVTEPTPFGLHDLTLAVETIQQFTRRFGVVVNRYGIGNDDVINYCSSNHIPVIARIPFDLKIARLYSQGRMVYSEIPEVQHQLDGIIRYLDLAAKLAEEEQYKNNQKFQNSP
ncbi:MAG: ATP-binding protein [Bacteroidales bacterium]|nr:ATP-binding protein [Bacteroidales bacterium]